jgi:hypothetical protein
MDVASSGDHPLTIRAGHRNLHVGTEDPLSPARWLGRGGDIMAFRMQDGRVVVSNSLWSAGEIPVRFRAMLPDNAEQIALPEGVTREMVVDAIRVSQKGGDAAPVVGLPVVRPAVGVRELANARVELVGDGDGVAGAVIGGPAAGEVSWSADVEDELTAEMAADGEAYRRGELDVEADLSVGGGL